MEREFKGWCKECGEEELYSEVLTEGLCLNCWTRRQHDNNQAYIDARIDYEEGCL